MVFFPVESFDTVMLLLQLCIQNNPTEARNMLLQNPQLAYALLQAQIVMKIVDPQVAMVNHLCLIYFYSPVVILLTYYSQNIYMQVYFVRMES